MIATIIFIIIAILLFIKFFDKIIQFSLFAFILGCFAIYAGFQLLLFMYMAPSPQDIHHFCAETAATINKLIDAFGQEDNQHAKKTTIKIIKNVEYCLQKIFGCLRHMRYQYEYIGDVINYTCDPERDDGSYQQQYEQYQEKGTSK